MPDAQNTAPTLPAPLNGAGKSINQRLADLEAGFNSLLSVLAGFPQQAAAIKAVQDGLKSLADAQQGEKTAAETRHRELLKEVAQSAPLPVQFPDLSGLQKSVRNHEERLGTLEKPTQAAAPLPSGSGDLEARVTAVEEAVGIERPKATGMTATTVAQSVQAATTVEAEAKASRPAEEASERAATPLDPKMPGYKALMADGRYSTVEAVTAASDEELDAVRNITPATVTDLRTFLQGVNTNA